jgi:flagellar hook-associated protein 2
MIGNIANSLGFGSGINVTQLVNDLSEASRAPKAARLDQLLQASQAKISAVAQARADLDTFADTLGSLILTGSLSSQPTVSNNDALLASALPGATLGNLSAEIEVRQLARAQTTHTGLLASASDPIGVGNLTLIAGGNSFSISVGSSNNSLTGFADAINASGSGVRASVVRDQGQYRLVLKGDTGVASAFSLAAEPDAEQSLTDMITTGFSLSQAATDAVIRVDGVEFSRPSNTINDVVPGISLKLMKAEIGETLSLGSVRDSDALKQTISDFEPL